MIRHFRYQKVMSASDYTRLATIRDSLERRDDDRTLIAKYNRVIWYIDGSSPPHYPVPALRGWNEIEEPNGGGVKNDCCRVGPVYWLDWSRGSLEVY